MAVRAPTHAWRDPRGAFAARRCRHGRRRTALWRRHRDQPALGATSGPCRAAAEWAVLLGRPPDPRAGGVVRGTLEAEAAERGYVTRGAVTLGSMLPAIYQE